MKCKSIGLRCVVLLGLVLAAWQSSALAQDTGRQDRTPAAQATSSADGSDNVTEYGFDDEIVHGDLVNPNGEVLHARTRRPHESLIHIRTQFIDRLLESSYEL